MAAIFTINVTTGAQTELATGLPTAPQWGAVTPASDPTPINPNDKKYTRNIVTFCNDQVFYGSDPDSLVELAAASGDIDCTAPLQAAEGYGKVFIVNDDSFRVADFVNVKLTTADIGSNMPYHGDIITGGSSGAAMVVDYIDAASGLCDNCGSGRTLLVRLDTVC